MLVQYSVENYKSIKDEIVINFKADTNCRKKDWIIEGEESLPPTYKCLGLIGPNASGKTNIIESMIFALRFVQNTIIRKDEMQINVQPFSLDKEYINKPTSFEFIFIKNGIKYVYGFSITEGEVVEEYLMGYFSAKPKTLFDRSEGQRYAFKGNDEKAQKEIALKTNRNRLYMPVAAEWGYEPVKPVYEWFNYIFNSYSRLDMNALIGEIIRDEERKRIFINELQKADFNISDIYIEKELVNNEVYKPDYMYGSYIFETATPYLSLLSKKKTVVRVVHKNIKGETFDIALSDDSAGTSDFVYDLAELFLKGDKSALMLEDELGRSYHTKLTQHYLDVLKSPAVNKNNTQMIFTSHDTKVLNMLNPDQIYLVDKDEDGATYVKLLDDYIIREHDNVELGYLKGRYGSIPYMKG